MICFIYRKKCGCADNAGTGGDQCEKLIPPHHENDRESEEETDTQDEEEEDEQEEEENRK